MINLDRFRDVDLVIDKANDNFIAKQWTSVGDKSGRTLTVMITNEGAVGELAGATVSLLWTNKANGLTDETAFVLKDKDTSTFVIGYPSNMLTPGTVIAQIRVWFDGKVVTTKPFEITVSGIGGQMAGVVKQQEFGLLTAVLADVNKFRTDIAKVSAQLAQTKTDLQAGIGAVTADAEVVTARNSAVKSKAFPVIDARLDELEEETVLIADNKITNGDFSNGLAGWTGSPGTTASVANGRLSATMSQMYGAVSQTVDTTIGNKYYIRAEVEGTTDNYFGLLIAGITFRSAGKHVLSGIFTASVPHSVMGIGDRRTSDYTPVYMDNVVMLDLTAIFGTGNEPTVAQMDNILAKFPNLWFDGTKNLFRAGETLSKVLTTERDTTVLATNKIVNGDFSDATTGWTRSPGTTASVVGGRVSAKMNEKYGSLSQAITTTIGNLYYIKADVEGTETVNYFGLLTTGTPFKSNGKHVLSLIFTAETPISVVGVGDKRTSDYTPVYMDNVVMLDLTAIFGTGNEPTVAQMDNILAKFPNLWFDGTKNLFRAGETLNKVLATERDTTVLATNKIANGDFSDGTVGWTISDGTTASVVDGRVSANMVQRYGSISQSIPTVIGNKYYIKSEVEGTTDNYFGLLTQGMPFESTSNHVLSTVFTASTPYSVVGVGDRRTANYTPVYMDNVIMLDLTAIFGPGNEPTVEQMDDILAKFSNSWFDGTANLFGADATVNKLLSVDTRLGEIETQLSLPDEDLSGLSGLLPNRVLVWHDEFNGTELDGNKWGHEYGGPRGPRWFPIETDRTAYLSDGNLVLKTIKNYPRSGYEWSCASLNTNNKAEFRYGRFEARIKFSDNPGATTAFWLLGAGYERLFWYEQNKNNESLGINWPTCGEVDIAEMYATSVTNNVHYSTTALLKDGSGKAQSGSQDYGVNTYDWHTYAVECTPDKMEFFLDGELKRTIDVNIASVGEFNPFRLPKFIMLTHVQGVTGMLGLDPDPAVTEMTAYVDYVRVYAPVGTPKKITEDSINIGYSTIDMTVGEVLLLDVSFIPDASDQTIVWESHNLNIVSVYGGKLIANSVGTTMISATSKTGKRVHCVVRVS